LTFDDDNTDLSNMLANIRPSKREMVRVLLGYSLCARFDVPNHPPGAIYTYPFTHRPLVDFMLAIPGTEVSAPGATRSLMRRAFAELVPAPILRRQSKGYYPPAALRAARGIAGTMLPAQRLEVVQRGWVDAPLLEAAVRGLLDGGGRGAEIRQVVRLEHWLTSRYRRGPAAIQKGEEVNTNGVLNA
jgi:hypothetical protein